MALGKTTELDAVNTMLSIIGEPPVNSISGTGRADALIATNILTEVSREVQGAGWHFNTNLDVEMVPDQFGKIYLADNIVRVDIDEPNQSTNIDIVVRGSYLYNRKELTDVFSSSIKATVIYLFDFGELPEAARRYIMIRAGRIFGDRMVGSEKHNRFTTVDEYKALADLKEYECDTGDYSIFDNYDIGVIVDRTNVARRVNF
jgi:hypothetical protein